MNHNEVVQGNDPATVYEKEYQPLFVNLGFHYAFVFMVYLKEALSLSLEPAIAGYQYKYRSSIGWTNGADPADYIEFAAQHSNRVSYLEFPVVLRSEFGSNAFRPFVSFGLIYGYRLNAAKKMEYSVTRHNGSTSVPYESNTVLSSNSQSIP
jgi:hypothetical protein